MKEEKIGIVILSLIFLSLVIGLFFLVEPRYTGLAVGVCSDSDNGLNVYTLGSTSDSAGTWQDTCEDSSNVIEGYCDAGGIKTEVLPCSSGYRCLNGICTGRLGPGYGIEQSNGTTTSIDTTTTIDSTTTTITSTTTIDNSTTTTVGNTTTSVLGNSTTSSTTSSSSSTTSSTASTTQSTATTAAAAATTISGDAPCAPDFKCGDWSDCVNGLRARTCTDDNDCGFEDTLEKEKCTSATTSAETTIENTTSEANQKDALSGTGLAVADNTPINLGGILATIIWSVVALGGAGYALNRYNPRWWAATKFSSKEGALTAWEYVQAGYHRTKFMIKKGFGKRQY